MSSKTDIRPVAVQFTRWRLLHPHDGTIGTGMAEAGQDGHEALFLTGPRRSILRVVRGPPAEGGPVVEAAIHDLALGDPRENAAMLTLTVVLQAEGTRRRALARGRFEGGARLDIGGNEARQGVRIMRKAVQRGAGDFRGSCEPAVCPRRRQARCRRPVTACTL